MANALKTLLGVVLLIGTMSTLGIAAEEPRERLEADSGSFFVGGEYVILPSAKDSASASPVMRGAMHVQYLIPYEVKHPYPIVFIHGGVGSGASFFDTPDGREGWAKYFARQGYKVYVPDQTARGRSLYQTELDGPLNAWSAVLMEQLFTRPEAFNLWPQASKHTEWPGTGKQGDPVFDNFMRDTAGSVGRDIGEALNREAAGPLLDKIGPAIVLGHSQAGVLPFHYADVRPGMVKAMIDIEGFSPAFDCHRCGTFSGDVNKLTPAFGVTNVEITYDPPVTEDAPLKRVVEDAPGSADLGRCWKQAEPARQLPNLHGIPTMVMVAEASYFASSEHCMSGYLKQAGVDNDFVRLEDVGINGNGHMMHIEKNSDRVAKLIVDWLTKHGL